MLQRITTKDGSHTLLNTELNEHYHSVHGAIQESRHVFIEAGLKEVLKKKKDVRLLEVGMGTGLNVLLTFLEKGYAGLDYISLEAYPLDQSEAGSLNYAGLLGAPEAGALFEQIHSFPWDIPQEIAPGVTFEKRKCKLEEFSSDVQFDLVYFDAFAPDVQPELWTREIFAKLFSLLHKGGVLVTYCAKGEVKRNMKAAGFTVERLPGPPGKREMTRAVKGH